MLSTDSSLYKFGGEGKMVLGSSCISAEAPVLGRVRGRDKSAVRGRVGPVVGDRGVSGGVFVLRERATTGGRGRVGGGRGRGRAKCISLVASESLGDSTELSGSL